MNLFAFEPEPGHFRAAAVTIAGVMAMAVGALIFDVGGIRSGGLDDLPLVDGVDGLPDAYETSSDSISRDLDDDLAALLLGPGLLGTTDPAPVSPAGDVEGGPDTPAPAAPTTGSADADAVPATDPAAPDPTLVPGLPIPPPSVPDTPLPTLSVPTVPGLPAPTPPSHDSADVTGTIDDATDTITTEPVPAPTVPPALTAPVEDTVDSVEGTLDDAVGGTGSLLGP